MGVLAGSIPETGPDAGHVYNTSVLIGTSGETLASYRKIHLFDIDIPGQVSFQESSAVAAGTKAVVADFEGWKIGLTVCYDLRFPHLYQALVDAGASILTVPAAFTLETGKDHWEVLLRARALRTSVLYWRRISLAITAKAEPPGASLWLQIPGGLWWR